MAGGKVPEICPKMHSRRTIDWRYGSPADGTIAEGDERWDDAQKRGQVRFVLTRAQDTEKDGKNAAEKAAEKAAKSARRPPPSFLPSSSDSPRIPQYLLECAPGARSVGTHGRCAPPYAHTRPTAGATPAFFLARHALTLRQVSCRF